MSIGDVSKRARAREESSSSRLSFKNVPVACLFSFRRFLSQSIVTSAFFRLVPFRLRSEQEMPFQTLASGTELKERGEREKKEDRQKEKATACRNG